MTREQMIDEAVRICLKGAWPLHPYRIIIGIPGWRPSAKSIVGVARNRAAFIRAEFRRIAQREAAAA